MAVVSLENNIKLYSSELFCALLKASNYKLDERMYCSDCCRRLCSQSGLF